MEVPEPRTVSWEVNGPGTSAPAKQGLRRSAAGEPHTGKPPPETGSRSSIEGRFPPG